MAKIKLIEYNGQNEFVGRLTYTALALHRPDRFPVPITSSEPGDGAADTARLDR